MADLQIKLGLDAQELIAELNKTKSDLKDIGKKTTAKVDIDADTTKAQSEINKLDDKSIKVDVDADVSKVESASGKVGGIFNGLGGAIAGGAVFAGVNALVEGLVGSIGTLTELALEADEIGDNMELAFRQAGLSGKQLEEQLESTDKFAFRLGQSLAVSPSEIKKLSTQVASLSGATGKANEDMTKLAIGIEKASGGAVSGEQAIKVFSRGIADPENAEAIDKLTKKFPQLGDAIRSSGDTAGKVNASLLALAPTFETLQEQAQGADAVFENLQNAGLEGALKFAGGIIDGLGSAGEAIAKASGGFDFTAVFDVLSEAGNQIGAFIGDLVTGAISLFSELGPILEVIGAIVGGVIVTSFLALKEAVTVAFDLLIEVGKDLVNAFSPITDIFKNLGTSTISLQDIMTEISAVFRNIFGIVVELTQLALQPLFFAIESGATIVSNIIKFFVSLFGTTKDVTSATKESNVVFEGFSGTLLKVRATIAGVVESARAIKDTFAEAFKAITSFDLKGAISAFSNLGTKTQQAFQKGYSETVDKEIEKRKQKEDEASTETNAKDLAKFADTTDKKTKKSKEGADKRLKQLEELFNKEKDSLDLETKKFEQNLKLNASQEKRKLTENENLDISNKQYENQLKQLQALERIFKITEQDGEVSIGANLSKEDKDKVLKQFEALKLAVGNSKIQLNEKSILVEKAVEKAKQEIEKVKDVSLKIQTDIEAKKLANDLSDIADKIQEVKDNELLSEKDKQEQILSLTYDYEDLKTKNALADIDKRKEAEIKATKERISKQFEGVDIDSVNAKIDNQLADLKAKFEKESQDILNAGAGGLLPSEVEEQLSALELTYTTNANNLKKQRIDVTKLTTDEIKLIETKSALEREKIEKESQSRIAKQQEATLQAQVQEIKDTNAILQDIFKDLTFIEDSSVSDAKAKLKEVENAFKDSVKGLDEQLKNGEISYNEYVSKLADLEEKRVADSKEADETIKNQKSDTQKFLDSLNRAGSKFLAREEAKQIEERENTTNEFLKLEAKKQSGAELTANETLKYNQLAEQSYLQTASIAGLAFGKMIADGQNATTALALVALQGLESIIPTLVAQIFGQSIATLGPILGAVASGALTATLYGLVAVAKNSIGAETGVVGIDENYKGKKGKTDTIPIWVAKGEAIINAKDTAKNKELLEYLNKGGNLNDYVKEKLSLTYVTPNGLLGGTLTDNIPNYQKFLKTSENVLYSIPNLEATKNEYDFSRIEQRLVNIEHSIRETKMQRQEIGVSGGFKMKGTDLQAVIEKNTKRSLRLV